MFLTLDKLFQRIKQTERCKADIIILFGYEILLKIIILISWIIVNY